MRRAWDAGEHIVVEVLTAAEALDQHARLAEGGIAPGAAYSSHAPDEMHVAEDGRPIAAHFTAAARRQRDGGTPSPIPA